MFRPTRLVLALSLLAAGLLAAFTPAAAPGAPETLSSTEQFATDSGLIADRDKLPGAAVYNRACAMCHEGAVARAPHMQWLEMMPPAAIVNALTRGVMRSQGAALSERERLQVAEYITRRSLANGLPRPRYAPRCTGTAAVFDRGRPHAAVGWGHDTRRFVPAGGVDAAALPRLKLKWAYAFPDATRARSQPAIGWGALYVGGEDGRVIAFDLATGCERWAFPAAAEVRTAVVLIDGPRPLAVFGDIISKLYALDAYTGQLVWSRRMDDHPSATLTGTPAYHAGRLYVPVSSLEVIPAANPSYACCTFRGSVVAVEAETGRVGWRFHPIPKPPAARGENAAGVERFAPSGAPVWASPTVDPRRGVIYVGSGENYSSPADGNSDALFAVDMATGRRVWQRQTFAGDAWNVACMMEGNDNCPDERGPDLDHSSSPLLIDLPGDKQILVAGTKTGDVFALDPDRRGALLWQTKVGRGSIQGGVHFGMAAEGSTLYVPINDMNNTRNGQTLDASAARPGVHAIDLRTGKLLWSRVNPNGCGTARPFCDPGVSAAITAVPGAVIAGHLDGHVRAYARDGGATLWEVNTAGPFPSVNGSTARGGGMSGPGAALGEGYVAVNSGYGLYFHEPGNALLVFGTR